VTFPGNANQSEEVENLKFRVRRLAEDKSYLQLILRMIEQINPIDGVHDMVDSMLHSIVESIGGTNIKIWFWVESRIHYASFLEGSQTVTDINDELVNQVINTREFIESSSDSAEALLVGDVQPGAWTWCFPLMVGQELIGVIKLENVHITGTNLRNYLPIFFSHAALILSNEIRSLLRHEAESALANQVQDLIDARQAAEQANIAKSRFLATMSHEIRTPMNGILGMAQMLMMPNLEPSERQDYAKTIHDSGQILLSLLNDILDISKVEAGKFELVSEEYQPSQFFHDIHALFAEAAANKGVCLELKWHGDLDQHYRGDPSRLRQMVINLVGNAIKFTQQGSICLDVREIDRTGTTATLEFSVSDTGIGIPQEKLPILFQPFTQADSSLTRQFGGTGLGLSIVQSLAKLMGGGAGVESQCGKGSRFWFRVVANIVEMTTQSSSLSHSQANKQSKISQFSGTVLIVEDNPTNQKVTQALLGKMGLSSILAANGQEGVELVTQQPPPDFILMDLQMPILDGYAATQRIRQWEDTNQSKHIPIVALTAAAYETDRDQCLAIGMDGFLTKPVSFDALSALLGRWLPCADQDKVLEKPAKQTPAFDVPRINAILFKLVPMLVQNRFDAIGQFNRLRDEIGDSELAVEMEEINRLLKTFRFDLALECLKNMAKSQGWAFPL
jgi:signal transduction histidine kinase/FixJ family two-component response regulator